MNIKGITSTAFNLPSQISSLIGRSYNVIQKNPDASNDAQIVAILATTGTIFGLLGKGVLMLSTAQFSLPVLLAYGLIGLAAGTLVSSPVAYVFFSKMKNREEI
jgi:hypothetical protein